MISIVVVIFGFLVFIVLVGGIIAAVMVLLEDRKRKHDE